MCGGFTLTYAGNRAAVQIAPCPVPTLFAKYMIVLPGPQIAGTDDPQFIEIIWADWDCGDDVDAVDSLQMLRHVAGFKVHQEDGCPKIGSFGLIEIPNATATPAP